MFEQMLSILLYLGDPISAAALLGGGKAFIAAFNALCCNKCFTFRALDLKPDGRDTQEFIIRFGSLEPKRILKSSHPGFNPRKRPSQRTMTNGNTQ